MKHRPVGHRRSIRLADYDYAQAGAYFVTICTAGRACLFGDVVDGEMHPNPVGDIVQAVWDHIPARYPGTQADAFVVMPNHVHGIVVLTGPPFGAQPGPPFGAQPVAPVGAQFIAPRSPSLANEGAMNRAPTLGQIVRAFKAVTARQIRISRNDDFAWQRNYYEHVIRNDVSLNGIRQYIADNPVRWAEDPENPAVAAPRARQPSAPTEWGPGH